MDSFQVLNSLVCAHDYGIDNPQKSSSIVERFSCCVFLMSALKVHISFFFSDEDDDDDEEDDTEALLAELEQIKKERAEGKLRMVRLFILKLVFLWFRSLGGFHILIFTSSSFMLIMNVMHCITVSWKLDYIIVAPFAGTTATRGRIESQRSRTNEGKPFT